MPLAALVLSLGSSRKENDQLEESTEGELNSAEEEAKSKMKEVASDVKETVSKATGKKGAGVRHSS